MHQLKVVVADIYVCDMSYVVHDMELHILTWKDLEDILLMEKKCCKTIHTECYHLWF